MAQTTTKAAPSNQLIDGIGEAINANEVDDIVDYLNSAQAICKEHGEAFQSADAYNNLTTCLGDETKLLLSEHLQQVVEPAAEPEQAITAPEARKRLMREFCDALNISTIAEQCVAFLELNSDHIQFADKYNLDRTTVERWINSKGFALALDGAEIQHRDLQRRKGVKEPASNHRSAKPARNHRPGQRGKRGKDKAQRTCIDGRLIGQLKAAGIKGKSLLVARRVISLCLAQKQSKGTGKVINRKSLEALGVSKRTVIRCFEDLRRIGVLRPDVVRLQSKGRPSLTNLSPAFLDGSWRPPLGAKKEPKMAPPGFFEKKSTPSENSCAATDSKDDLVPKIAKMAPPFNNPPKGGLLGEELRSPSRALEPTGSQAPKISNSNQPRAAALAPLALQAEDQASVVEHSVEQTPFIDPVVGTVLESSKGEQLTLVEVVTHANGVEVAVCDCKTGKQFFVLDDQSQLSLKKERFDSVKSPFH